MMFNDMSVRFQNPFDSSNRPKVHFEVHNLRKGLLSEPVGWVKARRKVALVSPPEQISSTLNKMLKRGKGQHIF